MLGLYGTLLSLLYSRRGWQAAVGGEPELEWVWLLIAAESLIVA